MKGSIRILIADDHPVVRSDLESMLASQPDFEVVGEAENARRAIELVEELSRTSRSWISECRRWTAWRR